MIELLFLKIEFIKTLLTKVLNLFNEFVVILVSFYF